jgi:D-sedoheptulose 7-phosphate isomerase
MKIKTELTRMADMTCLVVKNGRNVIVCGTGTGYCEAESMVAQLQRSYRIKRGLDDDFVQHLHNFGVMGYDLAMSLDGTVPVLSLCRHPAAASEHINDIDTKMIFAQQLYSIGEKGDILILIATTGSEKSLVYAATLAKIMGIRTVAITGKYESRLSFVCDCMIMIPHKEFYKVQELQKPILNTLCGIVENEFFGPHKTSRSSRF